MLSMVKVFVVSIYYVLFLAFEKWIDPGIFAMALAAAFLGVFLAKRKTYITVSCRKLSLAGFAILYAGIVLWVLREGGLAETGWSVVLRGIYYVCVCLCFAKIGNDAGRRMLEKNTAKSSLDEEKENWYGVLSKVICTFFSLLMIPVASICPYVFARADDNTFAQYTHLALEQTGSVWEMLKGSFQIIKEVYFGWQGTFSSIFMMSLQPAVFHERLYNLVPLFFIAMIVLSTYFFLSTLFREVFHAEKNVTKAAIWAYLLLVIQCIPVKQSAYMWYNGAVHYIAAHCVFLCLLTFLIRMQRNKRLWSNWIGAAFCAVYVGGANYVTLVGTLLLVLSFFFFVLVTGKWKEHKKTESICLIFLLAFLVNVAAPGNMYKMNHASEGYGLIEAFPLAFVKSLQYMLGEWMHWSVFVFIFVSILLSGQIVKNTKFSFPYPVFVVGYSWCYMAALFFAPLFTITVVDTGRFQNAMYLQWMLILLLDVVYIAGWLQRKYPNIRVATSFQKEKMYWYCLGCFTVFAVMLSAMAEPEYYLTTQAICILKDENLSEYEKDYWENIEILNSEEPIVTIHNLKNRPAFLEVEETEPWNAGLKLFYGKEKVILEE